MTDDDDTQKTPMGYEEGPETAQDKHYTKLFLDTRNIYILHQYDQSSLKDKHILTLAAAALGLSISYIDKIVTLSEAKCASLLVLSWIFFGFSLLSIIFSYHLSVPSYDHYIDQIDEKYKAGEDFCDINSPLDETVKQWNSCAMWAFVIGLVTFIAFVSINVISKTSA